MGKPNSDRLTGNANAFHASNYAAFQLHGMSGYLFEDEYPTWQADKAGFHPEVTLPESENNTNRLSSIAWKSWHVSLPAKGRKPQKEFDRHSSDLKDLLPLVKLIAQKIHRPLPANVMLNDLVQDGMVGLITALDEHDTTLGIPFRVFAENKIRWAIMDGLRAGDWAGRSVRRRATKVAKTTAKLQAVLNRAPSKQEIAQALDVRVDDIANILGEAHGYSFVRIDDTVDGETQDIPDSRMEPHPLVEQKEVYSRAIAGLRILRPNERKALVLRTLCDLSVLQTAAEMGISESRVSQLCKKATEKLASYI